MKRRLLCSIISLGLLIVSSTTVFAGTWEQGYSIFGKYGWLYKQDDGSYLKTGWVQDKGKWYHFSLGKMDADWIVKSETEGDGSSNYHYYINTDGVMVAGGFYDVAKWPGNKVFTDKEGHIVKGIVMIDNTLYYIDIMSDSIETDHFSKKYASFDGSDGKSHTFIYFYSGGKMLKEDGTPFSADDEFFSQIKYLPKYDSKGNFLGAIQN